MNITDLYDEHRVDYRLPGQHHHAHGDWVQVDCPYCSPGWSHYRLGWNRRKRFYNCWACGPHRTGETLMALLAVRPDEAMRLAKELRSGDDTSPHIQAVERRGTLVLPPGLQSMGDYHKKYLKERRFDPKRIAATWGVKGLWLTHPQMYCWRLWIPIHNKTGELVSWTTRSIGNHPKRYLRARPSQEKVNANYLLYGEHRVEGHAVVVHEGPTDVWATGPGAVATLGLTITMQQVYKIAQYPVRVVCFDGEVEAQKRADFLCEQLAPFPGDTIRVRLEHGKDAADCLKTRKGRSELDALRSRFLAEPAVPRQS